jgi:SAM-dependent methyltransferase
MINSLEVKKNKATEFPSRLLPLLRCSRDAGQLSVDREVRSGAAGVVEARLRCVECAQEYAIENGIACMMMDVPTGEIEHEMALKDAEYEAMEDRFVPPPDGWRSEYVDAIEIPPHLKELEPFEGRRVLELACGDGRFTMLMAQLGAEVLAVDFSKAALRKLARRLPSGTSPTTYRHPSCRTAGSLAGRIGLIQADAGAFHVAPRSFDRALSATPLDSRDQRMKMYCSVAEALKDDGWYLAGVEYDDLSRRLLGLPLVRRYSPGGILIEHLDVPTLRREIAPYFDRLRFRPIRPKVPFIRNLPVKTKILIASAVAALPGLRQLGEILLVRAERPARLPAEDVRRRGNSLAKGLYRWYMRRKGEEPMWDPGSRV